MNYLYDFCEYFGGYSSLITKSIKSLLNRKFSKRLDIKLIDEYGPCKCKPSIRANIALPNLPNNRSHSSIVKFSYPGSVM